MVGVVLSFVPVRPHWDLVGTGLAWSPQAGSCLPAKPLLSALGPPTWEVWAVFSLSLIFSFLGCSCLSFYLTSPLGKPHAKAHGLASREEADSSLAT